jgi:hypothetical protein
MVGLWNYSQSVYICEICGLFSSVSVAKHEIATRCFAPLAMTKRGKELAMTDRKERLIVVRA